ncbi:PorT family protein [Rhodocytophaga rosea]|uniref:PorT family protein n=1 Tax=Rhodocytophaga rosea TaxID=2704465 RepID=A0A6C0GDC4_9BACT|nr:porin family protein [Rhodocytophaga rosea]QHT66009.1 PorT family protein [Rhodocytophaga rosea]
MKKVLLSVAAMVAFGFAGHAQVSFIPKAGITFSNVAVKEKEDNQKSNLAMVAGFGINLPISEDGFFSVQPELLYIQKGVKYEEDGNYIKTSFNHIELPVLAKVSFGSDAFKAYVNAGPSFAYNMGGKTTLKFNDEKESMKLRFADKEDTDEISYIDPEYSNRTDFGVQFGGGLGFQAGPGMLLLDVRYGLGLTNFEKTPEKLPVGVTKEDYKSQNRVVAISIGYAIPLGN